MVHKIITRTLEWWVRPWMYYCNDENSVAYRPDVFTQEIYKEIADDEHPFIDTLEEWRLYAEEQKEEEMRMAAERRWRLPEKPSLCFKIDIREPSAVKEDIEILIPVPADVLDRIERLEGLIMDSKKTIKEYEDQIADILAKKEEERTEEDKERLIRLDGYIRSENESIRKFEFEIARMKKEWKIE